MPWENRWQTVRVLGKGGQGTVSLARSAASVDKMKGLALRLSTHTTELASSIVRRDQKDVIADLMNVLFKIRESSELDEFGALKVLNTGDDARDAERAVDRMEREIACMQAVSHPNLLRIIDTEPGELWYVSEFHKGGMLDSQLGRFAGNVAESLRAIRPLVEGVAEIHQAGFVHRDIKPQNIFVATDGRLILGDFGLVYFADQQHTRLSGTLENVGTRDWMPPWAAHKRLDELNPSFDVFALGKILWSMISGQNVLPFWYFTQPEYDVEKLFPDAQYINLTRKLFSKCIVEHKEKCFPDAGVLLEEIDLRLSIIDQGAEILKQDAQRRCRVCGFGEYAIKVDQNNDSAGQFGFHPESGRSLRICVCDKCGHIQLFAFEGGDRPAAWRD